MASTARRPTRPTTVVDQGAALAGQLLIEIGVAITRPAEFVTVRVSRIDNRLELHEQPERVAAEA